MAFRNIFISRNSNLSIKNNQLVIKSEEEIKVPLEDIECMVIESEAVTLNSYFLSCVCDNKITVFVCDKKHMPNGVVMPFNHHSRQLRMLKCQIEKTKPYLKRMWQQIVTGKIMNQARVLEILKIDGYLELYNMAKQVLSGDSTKKEAQAAAFYFKRLYGADFLRRDENLINYALNYTYSIIRGVIARNISSYGFAPSLGINHKSELNGFNLADDIIEPFRPAADLYVYSVIKNDDCELNSEIKYNLLKIMNVDVEVAKMNYNVGYAIELVVKSLSMAYTQGTSDIAMPVVVPLKYHTYE